jgi:hypothetical protein
MGKGVPVCPAPVSTGPLRRTSTRLLLLLLAANAHRHARVVSGARQRQQQRQGAREARSVSSLAGAHPPPPPHAGVGAVQGGPGESPWGARQRRRRRRQAAPQALTPAPSGPWAPACPWDSTRGKTRDSTRDSTQDSTQVRHGTVGHRGSGTVRQGRDEEGGGGAHNSNERG